MANELLAKRSEERGRKRDLDGEDAVDSRRHSPKRARSISSHSAHSIATISTNRSASASPDRRGRRSGQGSSKDQKPNAASRSPETSRKRRYSDSGDSYSGSSYSSGARHRSRSREWTEERNIRRRRRESSPEERGRHRDSRRPRSPRRGTSVDKSRITKDRRSMTPNHGHDRSGQRSYRDRDDLSGQPHTSEPGRSRQDPPRARPGPPRERSMSPYSKRLALTQSVGTR